MTADDLIRRFELKPHPEGGHFRETYAASARLGSVRGRSLATGIYYLLRRGEKSVLHRLASDEMWHFYGGGVLLIHQISAGGHKSCMRLGPLDDERAQPQHVVPAGDWFGAELCPNNLAGYAFVGCTVSPGFSYEEFEIASRAALTRGFPQHASLIAHLTTEGS